VPLVAALLIAGIGLTTIGNAGWAHAIGATCLLGFVVAAFPAALLPEIGRAPPG
jgi:hypothetical protein